jgi:hypothetical protein
LRASSAAELRKELPENIGANEDEKHKTRGLDGFYHRDLEVIPRETAVDNHNDNTRKRTYGSSLGYGKETGKHAAQYYSEQDNRPE